MQSLPVVIRTATSDCVWVYPNSSINLDGDHRLLLPYHTHHALQLGNGDEMSCYLPVTVAVSSFASAGMGLFGQQHLRHRCFAEQD